MDDLRGLSAPAAGGRVTGTNAAGEQIEARDVKFLGVVQSYNEAKKFGMVASEQATAIWGQEIYAYKDVLAAAAAAVGDTIRFGVHLNPRGQPQVSLPVWKIGEDGEPIGVPEGTVYYNCEDFASGDPEFLGWLKQELESRSAQQNQKRSRMSGDNPNGGGSWGKKPRTNGGGGGAADWGAAEAAFWGPGTWGGPWGPPATGEVTLYVSGLPHGVERREILHIFRQYAGFTGFRMVDRGDHNIGFATFATLPQAHFVCEALTGYVFDEEAPPDQQSVLALSPAKDRRRS